MGNAATDLRWKTDEKEQYRRDVWRAIAGEVEDPSSAHALILPADNGAEIPIMLQLGFREENIHAVDKSAAMLAVLARDPESWRNRYPQVKIYGSLLPRACERIRERGVRISAANLDLCGNLSDPVYEGVRCSIGSGVFAERAVIGLTMLKGRETATTMALLGGKSRVEFVMEQSTRGLPADSRRTCRFAHSGQYQNGASPMVWGVSVTFRGGGRTFNRRVVLRHDWMQERDLNRRLRPWPRRRRNLGRRYDPAADAEDILRRIRRIGGSPLDCNRCSAHPISEVFRDYMRGSTQVTYREKYCESHLRGFLEKYPDAQMVTRP